MKLGEMLARPAPHGGVALPPKTADSIIVNGGRNTQPKAKIKQTKLNLT